jgi:hypothetical protein
MTTDDCQIYQQDLDAWLTDWKEEVISNIESHSETRPQLLPILEAWANLNYHHTGLLITHLSPSSSDNVLQHTDQIILSSATLVRYQQKSLLLPVPATVPESVSFNPIFPLNWTIAHTVFSIGLNIPDLLKRSGPSRTYQAREVATRCLTVLAMFESEFSMLSTGFSEILEWLGSGEEV